MFMSHPNFSQKVDSLSKSGLPGESSAVPALRTPHWQARPWGGLSMMSYQHHPHVSSLPFYDLTGKPWHGLVASWSLFFYLHIWSSGFFPHSLLSGRSLFTQPRVAPVKKRGGGATWPSHTPTERLSCIHRKVCNLSRKHSQSGWYWTHRASTQPFLISASSQHTGPLSPTLCQWIPRTKLYYRCTLVAGGVGGGRGAG